MTKFSTAVLPTGFSASAVASGIKKSGKQDLALFFSDRPALAAGVFTTSTMPAAPVILCKERLARTSSFRAIIANSGNANCFTGAPGLLNARMTAQELAGAMGIRPQEILVASTGVIGKPLDRAKITRALPALTGGLSTSGLNRAAEAIMTTDMFPKTSTAVFRSGTKRISVCGVAKGAGMIAPNMATMLVFLFTDAAIRAPLLKRALAGAVEQSFNCITVDGCMSTNDTAIIFANGASNCRPISGGKGLAQFAGALNEVTLDLAKMMVQDGEGATKLIRISVTGASTAGQAKKAALAIANSNLFKTAVYGENRNEGRIVAAVGASGVDSQEKKLKVRMGDLRGREVEVDVDLGRGKGRSVVYTSDLTPEYIKINAQYS